MIITVTLNPAIDQTVEVDAFHEGDSSRVVSIRWDIGGKGINVARVLKELRYEPLAMGFAPGELGRMIEDQLNDLAIGCDFVYIPGETRTNITILDLSTHRHTVLNRSGQTIPEDGFRHFLRRLDRRLRRGDWLVLAGSIPPPGDPRLYAEILRQAAERGVPTGLDADGPVVRAVLDEGARPTLVKLNEYELGRLVDREPAGEEWAFEAARGIRGRGVPYVVVTRGREGAIALTADGDYRVSSPDVPIHSALGAGDAFFAGLLAGLRRGQGWAEALRLAGAAASATCTTPGTALCHFDDVARLRPLVEVSPLPVPAHSAR